MHQWESSCPLTAAHIPDTLSQSGEAKRQLDPKLWQTEPPNSWAWARLILLVFLAFSLPLLIFPYNSSYLYTKAIYALYVISFLWVLWAIELFSHRDAEIYLPSLSPPMIGLLIAGLLSLWSAQDSSAGLMDWVVLLYFCALYVLIANTIRSPQQAVALLLGLVGAGSWIALYALLQYAGLLAGPPARSGADTMISTLGNRNYVGAFLSGLFLPALALALWRWQSALRRTALWGSLALSGAVVYLSASKGAWLALSTAVSAFLAIAWGLHKRSLRGMLIALVPLIFLIMAGFFVFSSPSLLKNLGQPEWARSVELRLWSWKIGLAMFLDHPGLGVGLGQYKLGFLQYKSKLLASGQTAEYYVPRSEHAHNEYVEAAAEMGVLGVVALLWALATLFKGLPQLLKFETALAQPTHRIRIGLFAGVLVLLIDGALDFPLHRPESALMLVVLLGLLHAPIWASPVEVPRGHLLRLGKSAVFLLLGGVLVVAAIVGLMAYRDFRADLLLESGRRDLEAGRLASAQAKLKGSAEWAFQPAVALFHLGRVHAEMGDLARAIEQLERSLAGRVTEETYLLLAQLHLQRGDDQRAWEYVQRLLATEPHPIHKIPAYYVRAVLLKRAGQGELALAQLQHIIRQRPDYVDAYALAAEIHRSRGEIAAARSWYQQGLLQAQTLLQETRRHMLEQLGGSGIETDALRRMLREMERLERQVAALQEALSALSPRGEPGWEDSDDRHK